MGAPVEPGDDLVLGGDEGLGLLGGVRLHRVHETHAFDGDVARTAHVDILAAAAEPRRAFQEDDLPAQPPYPEGRGRPGDAGPRDENPACDGCSPIELIQESSMIGAIGERSRP